MADQTIEERVRDVMREAYSVGYRLRRPDCPSSPCHLAWAIAGTRDMLDQLNMIYGDLTGEDPRQYETMELLERGWFYIAASREIDVLTDEAIGGKR